MLWRGVGRSEQAGEHNKQMRFARKRNMNLHPIEQIRFPRKGNTLFTKNPIFENYVEFCRQNNANSQAVCHIPHKISRTQHSRQRRCRARPSVPSRRSAASRSRLRRCGGVRKREVGGVFFFPIPLHNILYLLTPHIFQPDSFCMNTPLCGIGHCFEM